MCCQPGKTKYQHLPLAQVDHAIVAAFVAHLLGLQAVRPE